MTEVKANEEYSVGFQMDERQMLLNVYLGSNFPNDKPKIVVTPKIQHEWIPDPANGEIQTAPGLRNVNDHIIKLKISQLYRFFLIPCSSRCIPT